MKRILSALLCLAILFSFTGCASGEAGTSPSPSTGPADPSSPAPPSPSSSDTAPAFSEENIVILQDYVLEPDGRAGEYTVHVVVLRNDNTETCSIRTHSCAIGPDDAVAEENRMEIPALGPGQVTAFMERFWPENNIDHVDTEFEISEAYGRDAQSVLRLDDTPIDHGVDVTLTNTGDYPVSSLSLCVLFFDEAGNCVDAQDTGMDLNSDGKPVRPGDTAVPMFGKELVTPAVFSSYEIYYHGIEWFD